MTTGSLMKVKSNAECSLPFGAFCNTFDLRLAIMGIENRILVFFLSGRLRQVLLYSKCIRFDLSLPNTANLRSILFRPLKIFELFLRSIFEKQMRQGGFLAKAE